MFRPPTEDALLPGETAREPRQDSLLDLFMKFTQTPAAFRAERQTLFFLDNSFTVFSVAFSFSCKSFIYINRNRRIFQSLLSHGILCTLIETRISLFFLSHGVVSTLIETAEYYLS